MWGYIIVISICISLTREWCWASFHVPIGHLCVLCGKMSLQIFLFFKSYWVFLLLCCVDSYYIFNINFLWDTICKYFFHLVVVLFCWQFPFLCKIFLVYPFIFVFFWFYCQIQTIICKTNIKELIICFLLGGLWYQFIHLSVTHLS